MSTNAELIARLRVIAGKGMADYFNSGHPNSNAITEAADAIEKLEAEVERLTLERDVNKRMRDQHFAEVESQKQMVIKLQSLLDANISLNEWLQAQLAAAQGQPVCGYDDKTGNCTRVNCCKQAQPEPVNQVLLKALSALLTHSGMDEDEWSKSTFDQARAAIKLATTKTQECGMCGYVGAEVDAVGQCPRCHWDELHAQKSERQAQPERAPLSDEQISKMYRSTALQDHIMIRSDYELGIRDAEAAHRIKQGGQHD